MIQHLNNKRSFYVLVSLGFVLICLVFISKDERNESQEPIYKYYLFDPKTILDELSKNNVEIFLSQSDNFEPTSTIPLTSVKWSQHDFLRIAGAVHNQYWKDTIDNWKLHFMIFRADCELIDQGPQQGVFELYKITNLLSKKKGNEETVNISPETTSILLKNNGLDFNTEYERSIDLSQIKIPIEVAFQIAEDQGGRNARLKVENNCTVSGVLAPDGSAQDWEINYFSKNSAHIFDITIDEFSGKYEITHL